MKDKPTILAASLFTLAVAAFLMWGQHPEDSWKQFTIVTTQRSIGHAGAAHEYILVEAQRADGSSMKGDAVNAGDPRHFGRRVVKLLPERKKVTVNDSLRAITTWYYPEWRLRRPPAIDPKCGFSRLSAAAKPLFKGEDTVLGFKTVMIQTQAGPYLNTVWKAPELDCATIKMTEERRNTDTGDIDGKFEIYATSIELGSPDRKLFEIPISYSEKAPSEMASANAARFKSTLSERKIKALQEEDKRYVAALSAAGKR
jgi:hypothetical protein